MVLVKYSKTFSYISSVQSRSCLEITKKKASQSMTTEIEILKTEFLQKQRTHSKEEKLVPVSLTSQAQDFRKFRTHSMELSKVLGLRFLVKMAPGDKNL